MCLMRSSRPIISGEGLFVISRLLASALAFAKAESLAFVASDIGFPILDADIRARVSGDFFLPLWAADIFWRVSSGIFRPILASESLARTSSEGLNPLFPGDFPVWAFESLALCSALFGGSFFPV